MVVRFTVLTALVLSFRATLAAGGTPDLSHLPPAACHAYLGQFVRVAGRISLSAKSGPVIDTGKVQIHFSPPSGPVDPSLHNQRVVMLGTLHLLPSFILQNSPTPVPPLLFFGGDCTIHYRSPWPREPSNHTMQRAPKAFGVSHLALVGP